MIVLSAKKRWYAVYTRSRAEKRVFHELKEEGIEVYLPLQKILKQWSDRRKMVETPLFSCYIFVRINYVKEHMKVIKTDGVVKFVSFSGTIEPIQDKEIELIQILLGSKAPLEVNTVNFAPGEKVKVIMGSLKNYEGEIVEGRKGKILFRINSVNQNVIVKLPSHYLEKINP